MTSSGIKLIFVAFDFIQHLIVSEINFNTCVRMEIVQRLNNILLFLLFEMEMLEVLMLIILMYDQYL